MDRMTRGFHRIGLTLAVPLALIAMVFLVGAYFQNDSNGPGGFIGLCAAVAAVLWYALCRATAWIVNGFRHPEISP